jgi:glucose-1-phosphate thymidylyltransferase
MRPNRGKESELEVVGLIPAAGSAARLSPLPCSKELYPVGFSSGYSGQDLRPKVACHYLLERMQFAGISKAFIILRKGKWDIPAYLGDGTMLGMNLAYLMMRLPYGVPYTIDQAYPFIRDAIVAMGHPDTLFETDDAFVHLLETLTTSDNDLVLGLFPSDRPEKTDMVDVADNGRIRQILIKPGKTHLRNTWGIAVWKPAFTHFIHEYLSKIAEPTTNEELFMSEVIQAAIREDVRVKAEQVSDKTLLDIGTAEDLLRAVRRFSSLEKE